ncbi:hypothetical protein TB1_030424 [Malus domestica]
MRKSRQQSKTQKPNSISPWKKQGPSYGKCSGVTGGFTELCAPSNHGGQKSNRVQQRKAVCVNGIWGRRRDECTLRIVHPHDGGLL